jgi:hypothetical protein
MWGRYNEYMMRRRKFVTSLALLIPLSGCTDTQTDDNKSNSSVVTETPQSTASDLDDSEDGREELVLTNFGSSAWTVANQTSNIGTIKGTNPTLTLTEGTSYLIENRGHNTHPLAFRAENGTVLLSQDGAGEFEDSEQLNWVDDGNFVELTVTEEFADRVSEYYCTVHSSMVGDVQVS